MNQKQPDMNVHHETSAAADPALRDLAAGADGARRDRARRRRGLRDEQCRPAAGAAGVQALSGDHRPPAAHPDRVGRRCARRLSGRGDPGPGAGRAQVHRQCAGVCQHLRRRLLTAVAAGRRVRCHGRVEGLPAGAGRRAGSGGSSAAGHGRRVLRGSPEPPRDRLRRSWRMRSTFPRCRCGKLAPRSTPCAGRRAICLRPRTWPRSSGRCKRPRSEKDGR